MRDLPVQEPAVELEESRGRVTFKLARSRGLCHGVERALRMARECAPAGSSRRVFLTSPLVHNPGLNEELRGKGVEFLSDDAGAWGTLSGTDTVILPAFGAPEAIMGRLRAAGTTLVDTTCGSVAYVWKTVERFARDGFTLVYHGRRGHEETEATLSRFRCAARRTEHEEPRHLVLEDAREAEALAGHIEGHVPAEALLAVFPDARGLRPEHDLERIGFASQTTMLASETAAIERRLRQAVAGRRPGEDVTRRFRSQETICGATQERQDALVDLLAKVPDLVVVVGGFTSSNTAHLAELAAASCPAYHVESPADVVSRRELRHLPAGARTPSVAADWLPDGGVVVGLTSGASTPEETLRAVQDRIAEVAEVS